MSGYVAPNTVKDGLIIYMDAANIKSYPGTGVTWNNLSDISSYGTLTYGAVYDSANNGNMIVDGVDDIITVPIAVITNAFTINIWVKPISVGSVGSTFYMGLVNHFNGYPSQRNRFLLYQTFQLLLFEAIAGGVTTAIVSDSFGNIQNKITMCSITFDGSYFRMYVNGSSVLATPFALTGPLDIGSTTPYLGRGATSAAYYLNGQIYNYQVYNKALTPTEILQNFNALKGRFGL